MSRKKNDALLGLAAVALLIIGAAAASRRAEVTAEPDTIDIDFEEINDYEHDNIA